MKIMANFTMYLSNRNFKDAMIIIYPVPPNRHTYQGIFWSITHFIENTVDVSSFVLKFINLGGLVEILRNMKFKYLNNKSNQSHFAI